MHRRDLRHPGLLLTSSLLAVLVVTVLAVISVTGLTVIGVTVLADAAWAQETTTTLGEAPGIIPRPNSGVAPSDPGDRGGALQGAVFFLLVGVVAGVGLFVWRQSRRIRSERGY